MGEPTQAAARASGSSFYTGMRILPRPQREAMFEIYAFCRAVDDIADDPGPREPRLAALAKWRSDIDAVYAGAPSPPLAGLARAVREFDLQREDFLAIIDGMEMDVVTDIRAPDRATLDVYCDRVACAVGRLSVRVFGMAREAGLTLAHHLGRALQLTNILRDLDEDAAMGRLCARRCAMPVSSPPIRPPCCRTRSSITSALSWSCWRKWSLTPPMLSWGGYRAASCARRALWRKPIGSFLIG